MSILIHMIHSEHSRFASLHRSKHCDKEQHRNVELLLGGGPAIVDMMQRLVTSCEKVCKQDRNYRTAFLYSQ